MSPSTSVSLFSTSIDQRILAVASQHLARFGSKRLTVSGVAEDAGMTHSNVYRYFPSKLALIEALAHQWLKNLEISLGSIADAPDPANDKLERLLLALSQAHRDLLEKNRSLFDIYVSATERSSVFIRKHRTRQRQLIDYIIEEGIQTGFFEPSHRDQALSFILDATHRFIHPVSVRHDLEMPRQAFQQRLEITIKVILRSLRSGVI